MHSLQHNKFFTTFLLHGTQRKDMVQLAAIALERNDSIKYVCVGSTAGHISIHFSASMLLARLQQI
jgi:putative Ca2+/H+ antiporter (TMEM165/GDT1 family)